MKFLTIATVLALCGFAVAAPSNGMSGRSVRLTKSKVEDLRRKLNVPGCNANICFAIDGSGSISRQEFTNEKNFVLDVASVIGVDEPVELAAVQYATGNTPITPLTSKNNELILAVNRARQSSGQSFVTGGINYCFSQLFRRQGEANKIVLLGDGRGNIGSSAIARANLFRRIGGSVSVVGAGYRDNRELLAIAGGLKDHVFEVGSFLDVLDLEQLITRLVDQVCA